MNANANRRTRHRRLSRLARLKRIARRKRVGRVSLEGDIARVSQRIIDAAIAELLHKDMGLVKMTRKKYNLITSGWYLLGCSVIGVAWKVWG